MKGGFALDRILFLRLRLSLKPVNNVFFYYNDCMGFESVCHFSQAVVHFIERCKSANNRQFAAGHMVSWGGALVGLSLGMNRDCSCVCMFSFGHSEDLSSLY